VIKKKFISSLFLFYFFMPNPVQCNISKNIHLIPPGNLATWSGMIETNTDIVHDGSFSYVLYGKYPTEIAASNMIPVSMQKTYTYSVYMRARESKYPVRAFVGFRVYDKDKKEILYNHVTVLPDTETMLLELASSGDTVITAAPAGNILSSKEAVIAFKIKDNYEDLPNYNISPLIKEIKEEHNVLKITLTSPIQNTYEKGTRIRLHSRYGPPHYSAVNTGSKPFTEKWEQYSCTFLGEARTGHEAKKFWRGARYVRPFIWFGHYSFTAASEARLHIDSIQFTVSASPAECAVNALSSSSVSVLIFSRLSSGILGAHVSLLVDGKPVPEQHADIPSGIGTTFVFTAPNELNSKHRVVAEISYTPPKDISPEDSFLQFTPDTVETVLDFSKHMRIQYVGKPFELNGSLKNWKKNAVSCANFHPSDGPGAGSKGHRLFLGWDEKFLYLAAHAKDSVHFNTQSSPARTWDGDSFQFAFVPELPEAAYNMILARAEDTEKVFCFMGSNADIFSASTYKVTRDDKKKTTFYELKIPFSGFGIQPLKGRLLGFNAVLFDRNSETDKLVWNHFITEGIAGGWKPETFEKLVLWR